MMVARLRAATILLCGLLVLAGCKVELYSGLGQEEANEIVALLLETGIAAEKRADAAETLAVFVDEQHFATAVRLLRARGLPRQSFDTIDRVFSGEGIVSSPTEERARLIYALGQELSRTVSAIDGVLTARVHVVLPTQDSRRGDTAAPSSAAVFVRHASDVDLSIHVPQIKTLVANAVPGLGYDSVSVALFPSSSDYVEIPTAELRDPGIFGIFSPQMAGLLGIGFLGGGLWLLVRQRGSDLMRGLRGFRGRAGRKTGYLPAEPDGRRASGVSQS